MPKTRTPFPILLVALLLLSLAAEAQGSRGAEEQRSRGATRPDRSAEDLSGLTPGRSEQQKSIAVQESTLTPSPPLPTSPSSPLPTPDETGAIIIIVQPGDSMWAIAARAGISLPELLALNNLTEDAIITPGDALIVGYATPEFTAPEAITPTATLPPPTPRPTATPSEAAVCLSAFDDANRNGIHDEGEPLRPGVAFTIYNTQAVVANYITDGRSEPKCLRGLAPGEYRITRSVAPGEILTTSGDWTLTLAPGSELRQAFGSFIDDTNSQPSAAPANPAAPVVSPTSPLPLTPAPPLPTSSTISPLLPVLTLFLGGLLLLAAVIILLIRQSRAPTPADPPPDPSERRFRNIDDID